MVSLCILRMKSMSTSETEQSNPAFNRTPCDGGAGFGVRAPAPVNFALCLPWNEPATMNEAEYESRIAAMNEWSESLRQELAQLISENPEEVIYHYTDAGALIGMLDSGKIWATHVSRMNDVMEYEIGVAFVTQCISANRQRPSGELVDKVISRLSSVDTFIACYSAARNRLSQWRAYCGAGTGYCIGLKTREMATIDDRMPLLEKVIYSENTAESILFTLLDRVDEFLNKNDFGEVEVGYLMGMLEGTFNNVACIIKHSGFEEEAEYRQIYQPSTSALSLETKYRMGRFGLTPYVEIGFLQKGRLPIKSITIGPCRDPRAEERSLRMMLAKYGYEDVEVQASGIPLRV